MIVSYYRTTAKQDFWGIASPCSLDVTLGIWFSKTSFYPTWYLTPNTINDENSASGHEGIIGIRLVLLQQTNIKFEKKMRWLFWGIGK